ncbi:MAG: DNA mismatch endonuclease Vsr [Proteobacteria bacterium]|nr:DNA mismatch endonuclease Vsr [Pseudomonadota bacterium]
MVEIDPERSAQMSKIRSVNTRPELAVRRALHARGFRFRLHRKDLPGKPDIVLSRYRAAVFVHGCFWHQHPMCRLASWPKSRTEYWGPKLGRNVKRDALTAHQLQELGWRPIVVWECDTRSPERLAARMEELTSEILGASHDISKGKA